MSHKVTPQNPDLDRSDVEEGSGSGTNNTSEMKRKAARAIEKFRKEQAQRFKETFTIDNAKKEVSWFLDTATFNLSINVNFQIDSVTSLG